jgi:hypothetical protein
MLVFVNTVPPRQITLPLWELSMYSFNCYHFDTGVIMTELDRYMKPHLKEQFSKVGQWFALLNAGLMLFFEQALFNQADGALTQLHLATSVEPPVNGGFYHPIGQLVQSSHPDGQSAKKQKELWKQTEEAILTVIERRRN